MSRKIFVALSGGVDSAVSAALLIREGYDVEGVYLKYASEAVHGYIDADECSWKDDLRSVEAVGLHLGIPVRSINVEREYNDLVISDFLSEYAAGRTPNPDILCNQFVKFGTFLDWAVRNGSQLIATGHYARVVQHNGQPVLAAGRDSEKDQSYFLHALTPKILSHVRFPIGHLRKTEVRSLARQFGLPNAERPDSQGVCFVGRLKVRDFLKTHVPNSPGPILDTAGRQIGTHNGLTPFTIGQRHGLGIGGGRPLFVVAKHPKTNSLIVGESDNPELYSNELIASKVHWPLGADFPLICQARIRYRQELTDAVVEKLDAERIRVRFSQPQRAVAPGQTIVLYHADIVIGGAVIESSNVHRSPLTTPV